MVEPRVPVAARRFRQVDEARELVVHALGHRPRVQSGLDPEARLDLDADRPVDGPGRRHRLVPVVRHLHRHVPRASGAAVVGEANEDLAAVPAAERDFARLLIHGRRNVLGHAEHGRNRVVGRHQERASGRRVRRGDHDADRIRRPADEVPVVLEVPARLHRVGGLPVDVGLPRHGDAIRAGGHVRRRDGEDLAVVRIRHLLAFRCGVLLEVRRIRVGGILRKPGGHDGVEVRGAVPATGRLQRVADFGVHRVDRRRAHLHYDVRDHVVLRLRVVVGEHELPLRTFHGPGRLVYRVAERQHLGHRRIVVEAVHDVRHARRRRLPAARKQLAVAEELHELAREVDKRRRVRLVRARGEDPVRARRRHGADLESLLLAGSVLPHPRHRSGAARNEHQPLAGILRPGVEGDASRRDRLGVCGNRLLPVEGIFVGDVLAEVSDSRVRLLFRERAPGSPRGERPGRLHVLDGGCGHRRLGGHRGACSRNRIGRNRLHELAAGVARHPRRQAHLAERELRVRRRIRESGNRQHQRKNQAIPHLTCPPFRRTGRTSPSPRPAPMRAPARTPLSGSTGSPPGF